MTASPVTVLDRLKVGCNAPGAALQCAQSQVGRLPPMMPASPLLAFSVATRNNNKLCIESLCQNVGQAVHRGACKVAAVPTAFPAVDPLKADAVGL